MTSKLLAFYVFTGMIEASYARAHARSRGVRAQWIKDVTLGEG